MLIRLAAFNARYTHSCPALFYVREELALHLPEAAIELQQFTINDPYYQTLLCLSEGEPDLVCFSVYIWNSFIVDRLVCDLAELVPETRIILGGPQAAALIKRKSPTLPSMVTVVNGEIHGVGEQFYRDIKNGSLASGYLCEAGRPFPSPYRPADFSHELKDRHIYYESSRGCPFACSYCLSAKGPGVYYKDVEQVKAELGAILSHGPKVVRFVDRTFNDRLDRSLAIWRFLAEREGETLFHFEIAPDRFNEEMFDLLAVIPPGRFQFEIGIQSTNPETLTAINRKMDLGRMRENLTRLVAMGNIHIHADLILGLPFDTRELFARSFSDIFALAPHYIQMGLLKVLPETPIIASVVEFGMVCCQGPPYEILANRWLDRQSLAELYWFGECVESFYNNRYFPSIWKFVRRHEKDSFAFFCSLLTVSRRRGLFRRAATQELLGEILFETVAMSANREIFQELLLLDWLQSGHRYLPGHLEGIVLEPPLVLKNRLWKSMPQNLEGFYDYTGRDEFFKRGVFMRFSGRSLAAVDMVEDDSRAWIVCFRDEREGTVAGLCRKIILPENCSAV